jgi:purine-binding chemotaxis protein CheW
MGPPRKPAPAVDWDDVRRRLAAAQERLERRWALPPSERRKILQQRASLLAREPDPQGPRAGRLEVVEFLLACERYGIESSYVREVYPLRELAAVPGAPSFVLGVTSVRGQILPVMDIKRFFDLPDQGLSDLNKVIIVGSEAMELGILADAIVGTRAVSPEELQSSLPTLTGVRAEYLRGVSPERLVVLDMERLLADPRIIVDQQVEA